MRCLNLIDFPYKLAIMSFVCFFPPPRMLCYSSYRNMKSSKKGGGESWLFGNQGNLGCTPQSGLMCDFGHRR